MEWTNKAKLFRERFYGRQDVYGRLWEIRRDGKEFRGYAPVCDNRWQDFCHLKTKSGTPCASCTYQKWTPVSDEAVLNHIRGDEAHIYYVLLPDGTIRFGAIDFDMKDGKEDKGYGFEDVSRTSKVLGELGVNHYIARSTGRGYHLYIFFDKPYPANKFRSFILDLFDRTGFIDLMQQGIKPLPEYFPKQSYTSHDGIGNGIKPPMVESRFKLGRNCWVDKDDRPIGEGLPEEEQINAQWKYFEDMAPQSTEQFDKILETYHIEIIEESRSGGSSKRSSRGPGRPGEDKWQQPLAGAVEKVLQGCAALRKIRDKALKGETLGHNEGFSLFHICMHTRDGRPWFEKNVPGWGQTPADLRQLEHSIDKNYAPWSCKKLQEMGICTPGTQCFQRKPPKEIVDGMEVVRKDLPVDQWPEPSPIRYAYGRGEDYLLKLQEEVLELKKETDNNVRMEKLKEIAKRSQVFDESQQKEFRAFCREQKVLKRNEITKVFNDSTATYEAEAKSAIQTREDVILYDEHYYIKEELGYTWIKSVKEGKTKNIRLCMVDIIVEEHVTYMDNGLEEESYYTGRIKAKGIEKPFHVDMKIWCDNNMFTLFFSKLIGAEFSPIRQNVDLIRQAALGFSKRAGILTSLYLKTQGFYDDTYLMPSCIVDANGIRPNTTQYVDLSLKETKNIDFQILSENDVKDVLMHLKTEFLTTWPELWTYTGLAHAFLPAVISIMGWSKRMTLFYEGLTGTGKSELTHTLQYFWGQFESIANFMSSPKGIRELGYQFKDALLVIDDYKGLSKEQTAAVRESILAAYDSTIDYKLKRNSDVRTGKFMRGVYTMSGEEFIASDAAVIARTILIEVDKQNTRLTQDKYESVLRMRHLYNGITPQFISWCLRQDRKVIAKQTSEARTMLKDGCHGLQNIDRIANNLAVNYVIWSMFTQFMVDMGTLSAGEKDLMDFKHWSHVQQLRASMLERCAAEQGSEVFLRILRQLIDTNEVAIRGLPAYCPDHKMIVGYLPKDQLPGGVIHIYPDMAFEAVKGFSKNQPIFGTKIAIGRQLDDQGCIIDKDKGHRTKTCRDGSRAVRVWAMSAESLGLDPDMVVGNKKTTQDSGKVLEFRKVMNATEEDLKLLDP